MHPQIDVEGVLNIFSDRDYLYLIRQYRHHLQIEVLDSLLNEISSYNLQYYYNHHLQGYCDDTTLYLPTRDGLVLALDKFTGEKFYTIDMGYAVWITPPKSDDRRVYALGVIPLSTGNHIKTNTLVLLVYDKATGKKLYQSQEMSSMSPRFLIDEFIHVAAGEKYYCYDKTMKLISTQQLSKLITYDPIVFESKVYLADDKGTLDIFENEMISKFYVAKNHTSPIVAANNLVWFTEQGIFQINGTIETLTATKNTQFIFSGIIKDTLIGLTSRSEIYAVSKAGVRVTAVMTNGKISNPCCIGDRFVLQYDDELHSLEVDNL